MVRLEGVSKSHPGPDAAAVEALRGINLHVAAGEFAAVVGPSGSGKSTLLNAMGGLSSPTAGVVLLGDTRVYDLGVSRRATLRRDRIGFVFQTFNLVPYLTCQENVELPARLAGHPRARCRDAALRMLSCVGLSLRRSHLPGQLSVGERQRVGIARALVNGPSLLLADEPTGNLDVATADQVMELLLDLNAGGQTIVMVTHDLRLAEMAGRVIALRGGSIVRDDAPMGRLAS